MRIACDIFIHSIRMLSIICKRIVDLPPRQLGKHRSGLVEIVRRIEEFNDYPHGDARIFDTRIAATHAGCFLDLRSCLHYGISLGGTRFNTSHRIL